MDNTTVNYGKKLKLSQECNKTVHKSENNTYLLYYDKFL